jgi:DNA polymerase III alpha subunit (gram-positive type)
MSEIVFCDTETTGLRPLTHEIWELAAVKLDTDSDQVTGEFLIQLELANLAAASPKALEVGGFHERYDAASAVAPQRAMAEFCAFAEDAVLAGLNISFDVAFLQAALNRYDRQPSWHYSPVDVKSMLGLATGLTPPWSSDQLAEAIGINPSDYERHSALADCHYTLDLYRAAYDRFGAIAVARRELSGEIPAR